MATLAQSAARILVVDDNPAIHDDFRKILHFQSDSAELDELTSALFDEAPAAGPQLPTFTLDSAFQGQEAAKMVAAAYECDEPYSLAFVDMRMPPGWDGLQTIEHLWKVDPNLQVVICTAYSDYSWGEIVERIAHRDRLLILKKPFDNAEVCQLAIALTHKWELERQAANRMDAIVETAADAIITTLADGMIDTSNRAACETFGFSTTELRKMRLDELLPGATWPRRSPHSVSAFSMPHNLVQSWELEGVRKDGSTFPAFVSVSTFEACDGPRHTAIVRDLSDFKAMQERLLNAQKLESVGQLAAGVAHEINTPMQYIDTNITFLQSCAQRLTQTLDAYQDNLIPTQPGKSWEARWSEMQTIMNAQQYDQIRQEVPEAIDECVAGVRQVVDIIRAMRDISHSGEEKVRYNLNQAIKSAVTVTRNQWKQIANVKLDLDETLPDICCVAHAINQVLVNLIVNAVDAIRDKLGENPTELGQITASSRFDQDAIVLGLSDTGGGIPEKIRHRVFDPFFTTKDVGKGTGQGLALAYKTVNQLHGGTIDFSSTTGEGTTFTITIPLNQGECPLSIEQFDASPADEMAGGIIT